MPDAPQRFPLRSLSTCGGLRGLPQTDAWASVMSLQLLMLEPCSPICARVRACPVFSSSEVVFSCALFVTSVSGHPKHSVDPV